MSDVFKHPWFQAHLPEGALDLNQSCLPINYQAAQQSPEILKSMVAACLQSAGPERNPQPHLPDNWLDDEFL